MSGFRENGQKSEKIGMLFFLHSLPATMLSYGKIIGAVSEDKRYARTHNTDFIGPSRFSSWDQKGKNDTLHLKCKKMVFRRMWKFHIVYSGLMIPIYIIYYNE